MAASQATPGAWLASCSPAQVYFRLVLASPFVGLEQLSERYAEHNRSERGAGFVFARPEREALFRQYVGGPGRRVLDLGCRDGALTRAYAKGNDVVGVDADRRLVPLHPRLFATDIVFAGSKPR